jgi:signal transduction histidine kinase
MKMIGEGADDFLVIDTITFDTLMRSVRYAMERRVMIMELGQYAQELIESEERFRNVIASNADAMLVVNKEGIVQFVNAASEELFGRQAQQFIGQRFDFSLEVNNKIKEFNIIRHHDEIVVAEMRVVETEWEGAGAYLASLRDVTDRRRAEEEREKLRQQLIQSEKLKSVGMLASGVAHELNNPLTVVLGFTQVLLNHIEKNGFEYERLKDIELAALRCKKIVSQLLAFSHQESFSFSPVNLNHAIENSLELVGYQLRSNNIAITLNLDSALPNVSGNVQQLEQVFINLLSNARDAMPAGGDLSITTRVLQSMENESSTANRMIEATFADTGNGIPEEIIDRIFDPFFTTKTVGQGTGLGLSMSMGIIERHSGKITVSSIHGKGTTFKVMIPAF